MNISMLASPRAASPASPLQAENEADRRQHPITGTAAGSRLPAPKQPCLGLEPNLLEVELPRKVIGKAMYAVGSSGVDLRPEGDDGDGIILDHGFELLDVTLALFHINGGFRLIQKLVELRISVVRLVPCATAAEGEAQNLHAKRPRGPLGDGEGPGRPALPVGASRQDLDVEVDVALGKLLTHRKRDRTLPRRIVHRLDSEIDPVGIAGLRQQLPGALDITRWQGQRYILGMNR